MARPLEFNKALDQVLFEGDGAVRKVVLNRQDKLNSLSYHMISLMLRKLRAFEHDSTIGFVMLKGNGRAFCAGGDVVGTIAAVISSGHWSYGAQFFKKQYNLDYLLGTYKKPLVVLMDGIVMGGGAGIAMNATFKIVTENTVFAMPEATFGHTPDVGASYFLSRRILGLTGARLDGAELVACGLASHFVHSKDLPQLEVALQAIRSVDAKAINEAIRHFARKPLIKDSSPFNKPRGLDDLKLAIVNSVLYSTPFRLDAINKSFSKDTVDEILISIEDEAENHGVESWNGSAMNSMKSASPIALKIFLRSIREGRRQSLRECMIREYTICCNIFRASASKDLYEGSRAMLFEKDKKPKWEPAKLELVSEEMVDLYFNGIDDDDWTYLQLPVRHVRVDFLKANL